MVRVTRLFIREFKHDVYARRQTAKVNSNFLLFSCNPYINHTKIKTCLLLFTPNTNTSILLNGELKTDDKSFIVAVCRLPETPCLRWLKTVSSTKILMGCYSHSLSLVATIMVSKNCPSIGEHVVVLFIT